jgi:RNA polymerase sigma-70 factor (family 1)
VKEKLKHIRIRETELLLRLQNGDEAAFASLFYAYKDKLLGFAFSFTHSEERAEDVVQEVFLKIWQSREKIAEVDNFNAFVYRIAQNYAIDELRRFSKETLSLSSHFTADEVVVNGPVEDLLNKEIRQKIDEAVSQLPPQQKIIYTLHNEDGFKYEEIASQLDLSVSTIRNHMSQAMRNIRKVLSLSYPNLLIYGLLFIKFILF